MKKKLIDLYPLIQHDFNDAALLKRALTHRSYKGDNNERLEFLGDSVLSIIISQDLFKRFVRAREGQLSRLRSSLVNGEVLAELAVELEINTFINLGAGEEKSGGRQRQSILADAVEAVIAAIYLDAGIHVAQTCVLSWYKERLDAITLDAPLKDSKSTLQEWLQARKLPLPQYQCEVSGESHAQTFSVTCTVEDMEIVTKGQSSSRRKAEQIAAEKFMEQIRHG